MKRLNIRKSGKDLPSHFPLRGEGLSDHLFKATVLAVAISVIVIAGVIAFELFRNSQLSIQKFGWQFLWKSVWNPVTEDFGVLPFVYGTLVSSAIALLIAIPLGLGVAIFLSELVPNWLSGPAAFLIELLAAIPSVIYGLIGMFVLIPWIRTFLEPFLSKILGFIPLFQGPFYGVGMLAAGIILAIMIVPFIVSVSREILLTVPRSQREAVLALGATHWEMVRIGVLPYARSGIMGSIFLALARALGETMAVTMVIGNSPQIKMSLFEPAYTMAAVIANEFSEATSKLYVQTLIEVGLVLFAITILVNALARLLIYSTSTKVEVKE